ncbi:MAG: hypothetical protein LIO96_10830 [Lachnospiraceae bacterium]|nr:hypothetical protein [Lachnospiraceae bacterium]
MNLKADSNGGMYPTKIVTYKFSWAFSGANTPQKARREETVGIERKNEPIKIKKRRKRWVAGEKTNPQKKKKEKTVGCKTKNKPRKNAKREEYRKEE